MRLAFNQQELSFIQEAAAFLEKPSSLVCATDRLGKPLEKLQDYLPQNIQQLVKQAAQLSLKTALHLAIKSLPQEQREPISLQNAIEATRRSGWKHTAIVTTTGAVSGAIGAAGLLVDLPLTTSLILRGISSTAQAWGHDLTTPEVQLQCLYVFTLGSSQTSADDSMDSAYISARLAYHGLIRELASFIGTHSLKDVFMALEKGTLPALVKFASLLVPCFEKTLLKSVASKGLPILGAVGSAALNAGFCHYYTRAARYHFGLMHLEAIYGRDTVHQQYTRNSQSQSGWSEIRLVS